MINLKNNLKKDVFVIGFALFAMFFGAGNLIFPPFLGWSSGKSWIIGFVCFILIDVGISLMGLLVVAFIGKGPMGVSEKLGKNISLLIISLTVICIGPLIAIPRTSATTYEFVIRPFFPEVSSWIFSGVYFLIVFALCIKQLKVVDIVGSVLAPVMFITLIYLIVKGIVSPLGVISVEGDITNTIQQGVLVGYQTMDMMGAIIFSAGVIVTIKDKGYLKKKEQFKIISLSGIVAAIALSIIYGGLTYMGATVSSVYPNATKSELLVIITQDLVGKNGIAVLGIIVGIACITTAVGLVSSAATFFKDVTKNKIKYEYFVIAFTIISYLLSNMGIDAIINIAAPILDLIYPVLLVLIFLGLFESKIKNINVYTFSCSAAFITCVIVLIEKMVGGVSITQYIPLSQYGFAWIIPSIIFGIIGNFIHKKSNKTQEV